MSRITAVLATSGTTLALAFALLLPGAGWAERGLPSCTEVDRFSGDACLGRKERPQLVPEFLAPPTEAEWQAQLELGWGGSDGSTAASDRIGGVQIGKTSRYVGDASLPANLHDWYYELGRSYGLGSEFRRAADEAFLDACLERTAHLGGLRGSLARADIYGRYFLLRTLGMGAWIARPGPVTPAPGSELEVAR